MFAGIVAKVTGLPIANKMGIVAKLAANAVLPSFIDSELFTSTPQSLGSKISPSVAAADNANPQEIASHGSIINNVETANSNIPSESF